MRLKTWVTLEEAANHLSSVLKEEVNVGDTYRLALDRKLHLSIHLANSTISRKVEIFSKDEVVWKMELPNNFDRSIGEIPEEDFEKPIRKMVSRRLNDETFLNSDHEPFGLRGLYDLSLIGSARQILESNFQEFVSGVPISDQRKWLGIIVRDIDSEAIYELVRSDEDSEHVEGSKAHKKLIDREIKSKNIDPELAEMICRSHRMSRIKFIQKKEATEKIHWFYPKSNLPEGATLVVRPISLATLEASLLADGTDSPFSDAARSSGSLFPWGSHHTKLMGLLFAATAKFWKYYDPDDPSTAPTNSSIEKWLVIKGVSPRVAQAMATIMRADGLKTGRR